MISIIIIIISIISSSYSSNIMIHSHSVSHTVDVRTTSHAHSTLKHTRLHHVTIITYLSIVVYHCYRYII